MCPENTYNEGTGNMTCEPCPGDYKAIGTDPADHVGVESCKISCKPGYRAIAGGETCEPVGEGYWTPETYDIPYGKNGPANQCPAGLTTIGFGQGADEAADCGRVLNVSGQKLYLRSAKRTTPSLRVNIGGTTFFGNMSTALRNLNANTTKKLRMSYDNKTYSVYDDAQSKESDPAICPLRRLLSNITANEIVKPTEDELNSNPLALLNTAWIVNFPEPLVLDESGNGNYVYTARGTSACVNQNRIDQPVFPPSYYRNGYMDASLYEYGQMAVCLCKMTAPVETPWVVPDDQFLQVIGDDIRGMPPALCPAYCPRLCAEQVSGNGPGDVLDKMFFGVEEDLRYFDDKCLDSYFIEYNSWYDYYPERLP